MAAPTQVPLTATVEWTEEKTTKHKRSRTIDIPAFWKDEYGNSNACLDGKTTISVKEPRWGVKGAPNLETYDYLCSSAVSAKSKPLTAEQFQAALERVQVYLDQVLRLEVGLRHNLAKEVVRS